MHERHEHEQYFFVPETVAALAELAGRFSMPCCLCAPLVGVALAERGLAVRVLDIDERFAATSGFLRWDIHRPRRLDERFGLIVCDPPFRMIGLDRLFRAIRLLAHDEFAQPLLICYPRARADALLGAFARFGLVPTGFVPRYQTVQPGSDQIEFYGNLGPELHAELARSGASSGSA